MNPEKHPLLTDEQILCLYFSREESAIEETDRKYGQYLLSIAHNILSVIDDCMECLNDTYLKTWNAIPPARPNILRAFLAKIMRHTAFDRYDKANRQKRIPAELCHSLSDFEGVLPDTSTPEDALEALELGRIISGYLERISDRKMYIFISRFFFAIPVAQIAQKLDCSESTIYKELAAMKNQLRTILEKEGYRV